jgi:hypothetical protein
MFASLTHLRRRVGAFIGGFEAGLANRRLKGFQRSRAHLNTLIVAAGPDITARARWLVRKLRKDFCVNPGDALVNLTVGIEVLEFIDPSYIDGENFFGPFPASTPIQIVLEAYAARDRDGHEATFAIEVGGDEIRTLSETGAPMLWMRQAGCGMTNGLVVMPFQAPLTALAGVTL